MDRIDATEVFNELTHLRPRSRTTKGFLFAVAWPTRGLDSRS